MKLKRLCSVILAIVMVFSIVACGNKKADVATDIAPIVDAVEEDTDAVEEDTNTSYELTDEFVTSFGRQSLEYDGTVDWMTNYVTSLNTDGIVPFELAAMEIEQGVLTGFGNVEIKNFNRGIQFGPMIGSIPFIGYIFEVSEGVSAEDFGQVLIDNADLRWNICTSADTFTVVYGEDVIMFVMHPTFFEEAPAEDEIIEEVIVEEIPEDVVVEEVPAE